MNLIMKRYVIFLMALFIVTTSGFSQIRLGIRGGVYSTRFKSQEYNIGGYKVKFPGNPSMGYHVGVIAQAGIGDVFIQPELLFCSISNNLDVGSELTRLELNKIDLPVMLGYKYRSFKIQAGPVASVLINDKSEFTKLTSNYDLLMQRATIGFQAGFGFDLSQLSLDFKYEGNLSKLATGIEIGNELVEFNPRASQFIFSIGLFFGN